MKFADLEYIALEGGGGKGAVYKGAIVALEKLFDKGWHAGDFLKIEDGELTRPPVSALPEPSNLLKLPGEGGKTATSILDYYEAGHENLKIKGISGSSAGAITAFPLSLGLTSDDIDKILKSFPFSEEFLPNHKLNEGKYRMVGMDRDGKAKILIGEDHFRKLGEDKLLHYEFTLSESRMDELNLLGLRINPDKDFVGSNVLKSTVRSTFLSACFSILFTGLKENVPLVKGLAKVLEKYTEKFNYLKQWSLWLKSNVEKLLSDVLGNSTLAKHLASGIPVPWNLALKWLLKLKYLNRLPWGSKNRLKVLDIMPADNLVSALGNIIWDRGIYAGFEVRELFFKILLLAVSKDTHFRRGLLERAGLLASISAGQGEIKNFKISFNDRFEVEASGKNRVTLIKLAQLPERLTFRELYEITGVNLCICVTNATTSQPLYFSHYFTPDFPVLEAVGASMNFPIAFKPTYNEANVLLNEEAPAGGREGAGASRRFLNPADFVKFVPHESSRRFYKESFPMREYQKNLGVVLSYIKETSKLSISVNGNLSFRSFLPYLKEIIENQKFNRFEVKDHARNRHEIYDSNYMKSLCYFYYNSAFKGLLIDGGATNNLPLSIFTFKTRGVDPQNVQALDIKKRVLALKLDNSFPELIKDEIFKLLENDRSGKTLQRLSNWQDELAHYTFITKIFKNQRLRKAFERNKSFTSLSKEAWIKVSRELIEEYKKTRGGFTPWNKQVNAISGLMGALQFGFDQGQIESIDDNENIIPLYCYGVGTLDFDLTAKDMQPLVKMAVEESEKSVTKYFAGEAGGQ